MDPLRGPVYCNPPSFPITHSLLPYKPQGRLAQEKVLITTNKAFAKNQDGRLSVYQLDFRLAFRVQGLGS